MRSVSTFIRALDPRRRTYALGATATVLAVGALFAQDVTAYFLICIPAVVPLVIWLQMGAPGIPVLPAVAGLFVIYYAIPILRSEIAAYSSDELVTAAAAVGAFLIAASIGSLPFLIRRRLTRTSTRRFASAGQIVTVVFAGLAGAIIFNIMAMSGELSWLGTSFGVVRAAISTLTSVACFLLGSARGAGILTGRRWIASLVVLGGAVTLSLGNFFLVDGFTNLLAAMFGYVIAAKRIPWAGLIPAIVVMSVLHAGKYEMRRVYWTPDTQSVQQVSLLQMPALMIQWFSAGISSIGSNRGSQPDVLERTSLLHMVLLVQRSTPDFIPYLDGGTYQLLPSMLLPRFLEPDKIESQAGLNLLSVRYGLQNLEATQHTTIAWGMVAEAFANFGFVGVVAVGFLFGIFCGFLMRLSFDAEPLSLPMFVSIAAAIGLLNVEMDFSYLVVTLAQTMAVVLVIGTLPVALRRRRARWHAFPAMEVADGAPKLRRLRGS